MITIAAIAMLAMAAVGQERSLTVNDDKLHRTITLTAISDDIVRVDVIPDGWSGTRLPSLASDRALNGRVPKVKINQNSQVGTMVTENGLTVTLSKTFGMIKAFKGETDYFVDVLRMRDSSRVMLSHKPGESFYGAGERGYSFNLAGDTLINYNSQNYGYQMGEQRTKLMGIFYLILMIMFVVSELCGLV